MSEKLPEIDLNSSKPVNPFYVNDNSIVDDNPKYIE